MFNPAPKKSYGQHFLKEPGIAERIALSLKQADTCAYILEVGPGKAMLSQFLLKHYAPEKVHAIEADADMATYLAEHYPQWTQVHRLDFLEANLHTLLPGDDKQIALIGNFPYNISTQIVFKLIEYRHRMPEMVGMFQKEVADRIVSGPGNKVYGITSVLVQAFYEVEYLFTVKPGSFNPPPKVQSAVIRLSRRPVWKLDCDEALFKTLVKVTFNQRRKMLRNTLKPFLPKDFLFGDPLFERRPETLSVAEFVELTRKVTEIKAKDAQKD